MRNPARSIHKEAVRRTLISLRKRLGYTIVCLLLGLTAGLMLTPSTLEALLLGVLAAVVQLGWLAFQKYLHHHQRVSRQW